MGLMNQAPTNSMWKFPSFFRWAGDEILKQGDRWSLGWWTGRDGDSHLILPNIKDIGMEDLILSPVCKSRPMALTAFILKLFLVKVDENVSFYLKHRR